MFKKKVDENNVVEFKDESQNYIESSELVLKNLELTKVEKESSKEAKLIEWIYSLDMEINSLSDIYIKSFDEWKIIIQYKKHIIVLKRNNDFTFFIIPNSIHTIYNINFDEIFSIVKEKQEKLCNSILNINNNTHSTDEGVMQNLLRIIDKKDCLEDLNFSNKHIIIGNITVYDIDYNTNNFNIYVDGYAIRHKVDYQKLYNAVLDKIKLLVEKHIAKLAL